MSKKPADGTGVPATVPTCPKCHSELSGTRVRSTGECKSCYNAYQRDYSRKHPLAMKKKTSKWRKENKDRVAKMVCRSKLKTVYGMTEKQYEDLLAAQRGGCAICGVSSRYPGRWGSLVIDHDHETKKVRGLLCNKCNTALGLLDHDVERFRKAAGYLMTQGVSDVEAP